MGEMQNENERLKAENDLSKSHRSCTNLIDLYYPDAFGSTSAVRKFLDLEHNHPSETAIEGTLVTLTTLFARPLEFSRGDKDYRFGQEQTYF